MALVCEDLASHGAVLVPSATEEYFELLADIEHRLQTRPKGSPPIEVDAINRISEHDTWLWHRLKKLVPGSAVPSRHDPESRVTLRRRVDSGA